LISVLAFAWVTVAIGIAVAIALGLLGPPGFWATLGLLFADVLLGLGLTYVLHYAFAFCLDTLKMCAQTDDRNVWFVAGPLMAIPAYWAATLLAKLVRRSPTPERDSGAS
jgi:hypothetical protein